jgi:cbb3-type cytochrome oxidase subunit 1
MSLLSLLGYTALACGCAAVAGYFMAWSSPKNWAESPWQAALVCALGALGGCLFVAGMLLL